MSENRCKNSFECKGHCWMNVAGDGAVWGVISNHCKGTLNEQKMNDDVFNGEKNIKDLEAIFEFSDEEKVILKNN